MTVVEEPLLRRLAVESGRLLGECGVCSDDEKWIRRQAETIASLGAKQRRRGAIVRLLDLFYRLARRAARTAR